MQDIVLKFENEANRLDYAFIYGAQAFLNYDISTIDLTNGRILVALFPLIDTASEIPQSNKITKFETSSTVWFGRKFDFNIDSGEYSNLDETQRQKYDRRLFALREIAIAFIEAVICGTDIELISFVMKESINQTNENLDFISCDIRLRHENIT
jgi:hypothetical protein